MPDILHRISIDAPPQRVHDLIASTDGIARWWTGRPLTGEHTNGTWIDTRITFTLRPGGHGGTTLLFTHAGWQQASEFMSGCSTNWGAYLTSLKTGAESDAFAAYPAGEISRWD